MCCGRFDLQVATQDWHPPNHISFASRHGREPFEIIDLYGHEQTLWPDHCVQGTAGATLYPDLDWRPVSAIVRKGEDPDCDSYSTFRNNWNRNHERPRTGLAGYLRERGIEEVFLCGLARDFCVKWSAEDAADAGFRTFVIWDATQPVEPGSNTAVRSSLENRGVTIVHTMELLG
jgi:nicotinamidase/pyrazinamidase